VASLSRRSDGGLLHNVFGAIYCESAALPPALDGFPFGEGDWGLTSRDPRAAQALVSAHGLYHEARGTTAKSTAVDQSRPVASRMPRPIDPTLIVTSQLR